MPLGVCAPRRSHSLAVHDQNLNRLLLAVHLVKGEPDESVGTRAISRMNSNVAVEA